MITSGIKIKWDGAVEFIAIDFNNLANHPKISQTLEVWTAEKFAVTYVASGEINKKGGGYVLTIEYLEETNSTVPKGAMFGVATIVLKAPFQTGKARWHTKGAEPDDDEANWKRVELPVLEKRKTTQKLVSRVERKQELFRMALLATQKCCAISGETTPEALEAAHIIAVKDRGNEVIGNGLLLRADLHRLYDRGAFVIHPNGQIVVTGKFKLSPEYETLLNGRLPDHLLPDLSPVLNTASKRLKNAARAT